jgi:hypothetical protein
MSGYQTVLKIRRLEAECEEMGFMFAASKHGGYYGTDMICLKPKDQDSLPVYSRDAELFVGTVEELEMWLRGLQWARNYDRMLFGLRHDKNRERKEQDERNRKLMKMIATGAKE